MSSSHSQVGYLIPLNENLEEEETSQLPKLSISKGPNVIGRNNIHVPDKRLSRNHFTLTASSDGSSLLTVEGMNPVVVNKCGISERKKVYAGESLIVLHGDVIEFIPGHYFFKYVSLPNDKNECDTQKRHRADDGIAGSKEEVGRQKIHKASENKALLTEANKGSIQRSEEAIRNFHVPKQDLPLTFRLMRVQGLPAWANTSCVSITDVIQGDIALAVLSNYMVDMDWLLPACPVLKKVPHVLVIHGEGDGTLDHMKRKKAANWILHKPPLPISYGTHHSKAMLLVYPRGVRVIIHTANLIHVDWNNKSQGLWMQDFPYKDQSKPNQSCGFENDLIDYLNALKWPGFTSNLPSVGNVTINPAFFKKFDYSNATVRLIASVPGYHTGSNLKKWGHMKLRSVLQECVFDKEFKKSPLVYQFSSLGSLDEKWMTELATSMSSGFSEDKTPLGPGEPLIIWPSVEDVRCSIELLLEIGTQGYAAGNAVPGPQKNVEKEFLKKYWAKWKASHSGRCRAMPHIKTFTRYSGQNLAWFLLTSSNLSKAAWGALQKNNSQLMIRSYELGVLFLPSTTKHGLGFSCTDNTTPSEDKREAVENSRTKLVTLTWQGSNEDLDSSLSEVVRLPVPYELPPKRYSAEDVPWSWDRRYTKKDVYGQVWPRQVQLYSFQDS
ncbi:hypothetical protein ACFE04_020537 [Oxalis oulophora]